MDYNTINKLSKLQDIYEVSKKANYFEFDEIETLIINKIIEDAEKGEDNYSVINIRNIYKENMSDTDISNHIGLFINKIYELNPSIKIEEVYLNNTHNLMIRWS